MTKSQWLHCKVRSGQFSDEFAISGKDYAGKDFSLFVSKDQIVAQELPSDGEEVDAFVKVDVIDQDNSYVLIQLPGQTFENGRTITVSSSELEESPNQQEA